MPHLDPQDTLGTAYLSETFRVLKSKEIKQHGEYRTARLTLTAWNAMLVKPLLNELT